MAEEDFARDALCQFLKAAFLSNCSEIFSAPEAGG
jgi:hypothetical protein